MDQYLADADLEEEEEEGLLASTGRRFGATWQDITGRVSKKTDGAGGRENRLEGHEEDENE